MQNLRKENLLLAVAIFLLVVILLTIVGFDGRSGDKEPLKIGFILSGAKNDSGWNGKHYLAMRQVCDRLGIELLVKENVAENTGACPKAIRELATDGANMIFLTSFAYPAEAVEVVGDYPHIAFAGIEAEHSAPNMTAYFNRIYQVRYLSGIIAGMRTKSNVIGYVAAMPNAEVNRGINAFALGVQSVNPAAKVQVAWTGSWQDGLKETLNARRLVEEKGADVLTYHQNQKFVAEAAAALGVDFIAYHETFADTSPHYLTSVLCRWEAYYANIVSRYLKGELNRQKINWLGIEDGVVYLEPYTNNISAAMRTQVENAAKDMREGFVVFSGEIYDNEGNLRCAADEALSDDILLTQVDWLVEGVEVLD